MRAVVQRVSSASVKIGGELVAEIRVGLVALVGVEKADTAADAKWLGEKIAGLRVFEDADGKMTLPSSDVGGEVLFVSNFTVAGDAQKGRRPSFDNAASYEEGQTLFDACVKATGDSGVPARVGTYGAEMEVYLVNNGPVTLVIETKPRA